MENINLRNSEPIKELMKKQRSAARELMAELNGKVMDYQSCRMLEDFLDDYTFVWLDTIEKLTDEFLNVLEKYK